MRESTVVNEMTPILKNGIMEERQAELITDGLRALLMEAHGYKTKVFEFISTEHTPKNVMIVGIKGQVKPNALAQIEAIKAHYGIGYHHLEVLLKSWWVKNRIEDSQYRLYLTSDIFEK